MRSVTRFSRIHRALVSTAITVVIAAMPAVSRSQGNGDKLPIPDPGLIGFDRSHTGAGMVSPPPVGGTTSLARAVLYCPSPATLDNSKYEPTEYALGVDYLHINTQGRTIHMLNFGYDSTTEGWSASYGYLFGDFRGHSLSFRSEFAGAGVGFRDALRKNVVGFQKFDKDGGFRGGSGVIKTYRPFVEATNEAYCKYVRGTVLGWNAGWLSIPGDVQEYSGAVYLRSMVNSVGINSDAASITQTLSAGPISRQYMGAGNRSGARAAYSLKWHNRTPTPDKLDSWCLRLGVSVVGQALEGSSARGGAFLTADVKHVKSGLSVFGAIGVGLNERQVAYFGAHLGPHSMRD